MGASTQIPGAFAPDGSQYATITDGNGNLITNGNLNLSTSGSTKSFNNLYAPDGSIYTTLTDGNNNVLGTVPSWVLSGATVDVDLSNNRAWSSSTGVTTPSSFLSISRASNETYTDSSGNLSYITSNTLANGNAGLQIWEGRTNLLLQSTTFSTWTKPGITVTTNATQSPDGTVNASLITQDASGSSNISSQATITAGAAITISAYFKKGTTGQWAVINALNGGASSGFSVWVDLVNLVLGASTPAGTGTIAASSITVVAGGWVLVKITGTVDATSTSVTVGTKLTLGNSQESPLSNGTFYLWGTQLEQAAFASPYIPTTTATAVRAADSTTFAGKLASIFGSGSWSFFVASNKLGAVGSAFMMGAGKAYFASATTTAQSQNTAGSANLTTVLGSGNFLTGRVGVAANPTKMVANGGSVATLSVGVLDNPISFASVTSFPNGNIMRLAAFSSILPDATLQALSLQ